MTKWCTARARCSRRCRGMTGRSSRICGRSTPICGRSRKKMIFMGSEFGQWGEWNHDHSLEWHLLRQSDPHRQLQAFVRELNRLYRAEPALWESDAEPAGFHFIDADNADDNVIAFMRIAPRGGARSIICVGNFAPVSAGVSDRRAGTWTLPRAAELGFRAWRQQCRQRRRPHGGGDSMPRPRLFARVATAAVGRPVAGGPVRTYPPAPSPKRKWCALW